MVAALSAFVHSHLFQVSLVGAVTGIGGAARADYHAFEGWKSFSDAVAYNWSLATWRWFQGGVIGAVGGFSAAGGLRLLGWM